MRIIGIVPARGGSKGIPRKALQPVAGRSLLAYTADAAKGSRRLSQTVVSTEDEEIAAVARGLGLDVPFLRPAALAADDTPMLPVLQHAAAALADAGTPADVLVLLQPTSPLRRAEHINAAIDLLVESGADSVVTVVEVPHQFNPVSVMRIEEGRLTPFLPGDAPLLRQQKPRVFARNGPAVLAVRTRVIEGGSLYGADCRPLLMSSADSLDIDSPDDLRLLDWYLTRRA